MTTIVHYFDRIHRFHTKLASGFSDILLLVIRFYWGYEFFLTGWGKLNNLEGVTTFFESLGIPLPAANAFLVGSLEAIGGVFLILGLGSRYVTLPLIVILSVAFATDDHEALVNIFSNPDGFFSATPFLFLAAVLIILAFGAGRISLDVLAGRWWKHVVQSAKGRDHGMSGATQSSLT